MARGRRLRGSGDRSPLGARRERAAAGRRRDRRRWRASAARSPRSSAAAVGSSSPSIPSSPSTAPSSSRQPEETTAGRIVAAGGSARASSASVTDGEAPAQPVRGAGRRSAAGSTPSSTSPASPARPTSPTAPRRTGWPCSRSTSGGYLNVLKAALPLMAAAGHGRVLGVTSGSGWRAADAGGYSCAKRAVAALTWQLGRHGAAGRDRQRDVADRRHPDGRRGPRAGPPGGPGRGRWRALARLDARTRGPRPARRLPGRRRVRVVHRPGALRRGTRGGGGRRAPPARSGAQRPARPPWPAVLEAVVPRAFASAEASQASDGGGNPRFGPIFEEPARRRGGTGERPVLRHRQRPPELAASVAAALEARSMTCHRVDVAHGFAGRRRARCRPLVDDARADRRRRRRPGGWCRHVGTRRKDGSAVLAEHRGIIERHPHRRRHGPGRPPTTPPAPIARCSW